MRNKIPIIITAVMLFSNTTYAANTSSDDMATAIGDALKKYCVPPDNHNCNPLELATYKEGKCVPNEANRFWIPNRRLALELKCPVGYRRVFAEHGVCPVGTRKVWVPSHKSTNLCKIHNFIE